MCLQKKTPRIAARCPLVVLFNVRSLHSDGISASLRTTARKLPCQALPEVANRISETHAVLSSHVPKLFDFWSTRRKSASLPANGSGYPSPFLSKPVDRIPSDRINDLAASFLRGYPRRGLMLAGSNLRWIPQAFLSLAGGKWNEAWEAFPAVYRTPSLLWAP